MIEPGIGTRWEEKWRKIYRIESVDTLEETLARVGVKPEQVTHVVESHCHWDHIGSQVVSQDGKLAPLFPNARHFAPKIEIAMAKKPGHARAASYRAEDVLCIEQRGLLESYEGTKELLPGLVAHVLGGHSDGVSVITLGEGAERAIFWSDVVPTTHHVQPPYIMAYDLDVVRSFEVRSQWLEEAARGELARHVLPRRARAVRARAQGREALPLRVGCLRRSAKRSGEAGLDARPTLRSAISR